MEKSLDTGIILFYNYLTYMNKPIPFDFAQLEKLCQLQCTKSEICFYFKIKDETLTKVIKKEYGINFAEYYELKQAHGRVALRRLQMQAAQKGNISMLMFLGKQYLGQSDKQDITHEEKLSKHERLLRYIKEQRPEKAITNSQEEIHEQPKLPIDTTGEEK